MKLKYLLLLPFFILLSGCQDTIFIIEDYETQVIVSEAEQLQGNLSSDKIYIIDGIIDMRNISIIVPPTGLSMAGSGQGSFGVSGFYSNQSNYTLFTYDNLTYSGNLFLSGGLEINIEGENSQIYDLDNKGNFGAVETNIVNYNNCKSIGSLYNYRQALGDNIGVFGCETGLEFGGTWLGGARFTTMIVRNFGDNGTLFYTKNGLTFGSRFFTNANVDLGTNSSLLNFNESHFISDGNLQLNGMSITRNGLLDIGDPKIIPNIDRGNVKSLFRDNLGIKDTFEGIEMKFNISTLTPLTQNNITKALGTTIYSDAQHFSGSGNNSMIYNADIDKDFLIKGQVTLETMKGDVVDVILRKWDNSTNSYVEISRQEMNLINAVSIDDLGIFIFNSIIELSKDDRVEIWLENTQNNGDARILKESYLIVSKR